MYSSASELYRGFRVNWIALIAIKITETSKNVSGKTYNNIVKKNTVHINNNIMARRDTVLALSAKEAITG